MLDIEQKHLLTIETTSTAPALESSLRLIKKYLAERLVERQQESPFTHECRVIIDLRTLDWKRAGKGPVGYWKSGDTICALRLCRSSLLLGPIYNGDTGKGPCPFCLERRWNAIHLTEEQALGTGPEELLLQPLAWLTPFALETIWAIVETMLFKEGTPSNQGSDQVYELRLDSLHLSKQQLLADPYCSFCTSRRRDSSEAANIQLVSRSKSEILTYHPVKATAYAFPVSGYINPICGMLGAETLLHETQLINTTAQGIFFQRNASNAHITPTVWTGFGATYADGLRHGILEGLERWAGQKPRSKETVVFGSLKDLQAETFVLDPRACGLYQKNATNGCVPYTPDLQIPWVWGYSFRQSQPILVPEQCAYYSPDTQFPCFVRETSSGCASGSCIEEAIFFGLLELIERDGIMLTWYANQSPRRIDPWSSPDKYTLFIIDRINRLGYDLHLLDLRFDTRIPSTLAVAVLREDGFGKLAVGGGASFDPTQAISAAVREVGVIVQGICRNIENQPDEWRAKTQDYTKVLALVDHAAIYGLPEMAEKAAFLFQNPDVRSITEAYSDWEALRPQSFDLRDDVQYSITEMLRLGMDVIVVEQTSPEQEQVGVKTARVIVPGLLPIDFGWRNARILDLPRFKTAPRVAGYRETNFDPAEYNRHPHPFA